MNLINCHRGSIIIWFRSSGSHSLHYSVLFCIHNLFLFGNFAQFAYVHPQISDRHRWKYWEQALATQAHAKYHPVVWELSCSTIAEDYLNQVSVTSPFIQKVHLLRIKWTAAEYTPYAWNSGENNNIWRKHKERIKSNI